MSSRIRALAIIELLSRHPLGLPLREISRLLEIPRTAAERLLAGLVADGYLRRDAVEDTYGLRVRLAALGLAYLGASGITDLVQPILDDLAKRTGELVRLAVVEGDRLTWVAKSQSTHSGLFYIPDADQEVYLPATANGLAWLATLDDQTALRLAKRHGFNRTGLGPNAPRTLDGLMLQVREARGHGFATVTEAYEAGTSAIAAAIRKRGAGRVVGTVSVAGPTLRMTPERMQQIGPWLLATAEELGAAASSSPLFAST